MQKLFLKNFLKQRSEKLIELTYQQLAALFGIGSVFPWPLGMTASLKSLLHQMSCRLQQNITCTLYFIIHHSNLYHCCSLKCTCIIKDQLKDFDFVFQFTALLILYRPTVTALTEFYNCDWNYHLCIINSKSWQVCCDSKFHECLFLTLELKFEK